MNKVLLYHQCGHNDVWNFQIFDNDSVGDGFILSPKMRSSKENILNLDVNKKCISFFDPQFYNPKSHLAKLSEYDFFPNVISSGYKTIEYDKIAKEAAQRCVDFQYDQDFQYIIIPTVTYEDTPQNYLEILTQLYIEPFINSLSGKSNKKVLLTITVKDAQLDDHGYITDLLNLITRYNEIYGIYLIPYIHSNTKRIKDINFIYNLLSLIRLLKENDYYVHLGYSDIEGLLFTLADIDSVSIGTYENLRRFDLANFDVKDKDKHPSPPNKRIYSNRLLQWIDLNYIGALMDYNGFDDLFEQNKYLTYNVPDEINWHFKWPELYKHYLISLRNQYSLLPNSYAARYRHLSDLINMAIQENEQIKTQGILFNNDCDGSHLFAWATAINKFFKR